jgi:hypothetical protein
MAAREWAAAALLLATALTAGAHGPPPDRLYDPLTHPIGLWLAPQGFLAAAEPGAGAEPFANAPLDWSTSLPLAVSLLGGLGAHVVLRADSLVLPRPQDMAILEVASLRNGEVVEGSAQVLRAPETPMRPDVAYPFDVRTGALPGPLAPSDKLGLRVSFLGTVPAGTASILLGPEASTVNFTARAADLDALGHEHAGWAHARYEDVADTLGATQGQVLDIEVHHGDPDTVTFTGPSDLPVLIRLLAPESPEQGAEHGLWGIERPHVLHIQGPGVNERVNVYPGEVLGASFRFQPGMATIACEENCNRTGTFATLDMQGNASTPSPAGGVQGQRIHLDPGRSHEVNLQLDRNTTLTWSFRTEPPQALRYDLHSHEGARVITHAQGSAPAANGTFSAPADGVYSLFWENDGGAGVDLLYSASGGRPVPPAARPAPFPELAAMVLPLAAALLLARKC